MKEKVLYLSALVIMLIALIIMSLNFFILPLPDWAVRIAGIVILADLVTLIYSGIRLKNQS